MKVFSMRMHGSPRRRVRRPADDSVAEVQLLEPRLQLSAAASGIAWVNAPSLDVSFAPDGTDVAGHQSNLHDAFNRIAPEAEWQSAILDAFSVWTTHIDAEVGTTSDSGDPFGAPGAGYNDPRFGEVRVAAIPASEDYHAFSIAHDEFVSGTWSGDIIFNSNWRPRSLDDIFRVALHEAGHVLGLGHNDNPDSPMFEHDIPQSIEPTQDDIDDLQALYGEPTAPGVDNRAQRETTDQNQKNGGFANATTLNPTTGFKYGRYTLEGRIESSRDVDIYRFEGHPHTGAQTDSTSIVIQSQERGGLIPRVTLYNSRKKPIQNVRITRNGNGVLVLETRSINPRLDYFLKVEAATSDAEFSAGDYRLTVSSRPEGVEAETLLHGTVRRNQPVSQHTLYLGRAQLMSLSLVVGNARMEGQLAIAVHDHRGRLITTTSAAPGETRSMPTMLLRAGRYFVTARGASSGTLPTLNYSLVGLQSDQENGPRPSDPTGAPAFPCEDSPDFCFDDGTISPEPIHEEPGAGDNPPDFDPFPVPVPWTDWWYTGGSIWLAAHADTTFAAAGRITSIDVLANDESVPPAEIQSVSQPDVGSVVVADEELDFDIPDDVTGSLSFDYTIGARQASLGEHDVTEQDRFGSSVDAYADLVVVGSPYADTNANNAGAAYVYQRDGSDWLFVQKLTASDAAANDRFGTAVAVHGSTIVVTSPRDDDYGSNSGGAYVFEFEPTLGQFVQSAKLVDTTGHSKDFFGESVAIEFDTIVIGARNDDGQGTNSGSAFVFGRGQTGWDFEQKLKASDAAAFSQFGSSVGLSGNTIVVGARKANANGTDSGAAYVFERSGLNAPFTETTRFVPAEIAAADEFGGSVAISADRIVIGAALSDISENNAGAAWLFSRGGEEWNQSAILRGTAAGDRFGTAVDIFDETVAVASPTADPGESNAGAVDIFTATSGGLTQPRQLTDDAAAAGNQFGSSVAISRFIVATGSARDDEFGTNSGEVLVEDLRIATATVTVEVGEPMRATSVGDGSDRVLTQRMLDREVRRLSFWFDVPSSATFEIVDLPSDLLGLTVDNRILIDHDAAGHGWHYRRISRAAGRMHLRTVIAHELGHLNNHTHEDIEEFPWMSDVLEPDQSLLQIGALRESRSR